MSKDNTKYLIEGKTGKWFPESREFRPTQEDEEVGDRFMILAEIADHAHEVHAEHVAAEAEEERLAEAEEAGVAPEQIDGDGEQGVAEIFAPQVEGEVADDAGGIQQWEDDDQQRRDNGDGDELDAAGSGSAHTGEWRRGVSGFSPRGCGSS